MGLYEENKKVHDQYYKVMKEEGEPFHPFSTWKDIVVAFAVLLILLALTFIFGVHLDAPADPTSQYLPRPEWYFMFLFQLLKYFPGPTAVIAVAIIPGIAAAALILLPFYDRNPYRSPKKRPLAVTLMTLGFLSLVGLTVLAYAEDAQHAAANPHVVGAGTTPGGHGGAVTGDHGGTQDGAAIFASNCTMCHGAAGTQIPNVALFDKAFIEGRDVVAVVTNGKGGMPAFGGRLKPEEIQAVADYLKSNAK